MGDTVEKGVGGAMRRPEADAAMVIGTIKYSSRWAIGCTIATPCKHFFQDVQNYRLNW
jgi:hypothetical protein